MRVTLASVQSSFLQLSLSQSYGCRWFQSNLIFGSEKTLRVLAESSGSNLLGL